MYTIKFQDLWRIKQNKKGIFGKRFFFDRSDGIYIEPRVYQNYYKNMLKSSKVKEYNFHI